MVNHTRLHRNMWFLYLMLYERLDILIQFEKYMSHSTKRTTIVTEEAKNAHYRKYFVPRKERDNYSE
jgi:hypothetical protein